MRDALRVCNASSSIITGRAGTRSGDELEGLSHLPMPKVNATPACRSGKQRRE